MSHDEKNIRQLILCKMLDLVITHLDKGEVFPKNFINEMKDTITPLEIKLKSK